MGKRTPSTKDVLVGQGAELGSGQAAVDDFWTRLNEEANDAS